MDKKESEKYDFICSYYRAKCASFYGSRYND